MTDLKCMYCAELGITNTDVFIEIVDVELGPGWICKECFLESEKEKDEHLKQLEDELSRKEQECEKLKWYLNEIRDQELKHLDIEWDEYETQCKSTEYSNIINLVEEALEERSPEVCRYVKE